MIVEGESVSGRAGDAFGLQRFDDRIASRRVEAQHEEVITVTRAMGRTLLRKEARKFRKAGGEILAVAVAGFSLGLEAVELGVEDGALEFTEAIIAGHDVMFVPNALRDAAAVLDRATGFGERVVVCGDDPAFSGSEILAGLE